MPYKYIGRTTDFRGKSLWEIVGNLKNFGVGRIVVRSRMECYPEPTFMKILKVEPLECPQNQNIDNLRKVRVLVEKTFRGVKLPQPVCIKSASYKTDYRLLSKDEEEAYCSGPALKPDERIMPKYMDFPPLMKEVIAREKRAKGEDVSDLKIEILYRHPKLRIAKEGEKPTKEFPVNMTELPKIDVYKGVRT